MKSRISRIASGGFTFAELAIAIAIIALLLGGAFATMSTQLELRQISETRRTLEQVRDALVGFVLANGRLPCPAAPSSTGVESISSPGTSSTGGACTNPYNGYVPGSTLGITPTDSSGYVVDAWGHRLRFAVTAFVGPTPCTTPCFTTAGSIKTELPLGSFQNLTLVPKALSICSSATNMTNVGTTSVQCASVSKLTDSAIAVVFSTGKNTSTGGTGTDETKNTDGDGAFVYHEQSDSSATNGEFDDIVIWLSPNVLFTRMSAAGVL